MRVLLQLRKNLQLLLTLIQILSYHVLNGLGVVVDAVSGCFPVSQQQPGLICGSLWHVTVQSRCQFQHVTVRGLVGPRGGNVC